MSEFLVQMREKSIEAVHNGDIKALYELVEVHNNELNDDFVKYFDESVPYRAATDFMQDNLSGMMVVEISVKTGKSSGINDPQYLRSVSDFSDWLRDRPETDHVNTITDTLKRLLMVIRLCVWQ